PVQTPAPSVPPTRWGKVEQWLEEHFWVPMVAVVAVGFLVRVIAALPTYLNPDEAMHVLRSSLPTMWDVYRADLEGPDPSLLHVFLFPLCKMLASDLWLRLPSVLAGTAAIFFMYKWLEELFDRTTGLIGMVLLAFAPAVVYFSAEIRAYSILVFFSVCALYCLEAGVRRRSPVLLLLAGVAQCLALVSQYSGLILLGVLGCYSLYVVLRRRVRGRALAGWMAGEFLAVGLLVFQYLTHISKLHGSDIEGIMKSGFLRRGYFDPAHETVLAFVAHRTWRVFAFLFSSSAIGSVALALFVAGTVLLAVRGLRQGDGRSRREVAFLFLAPLAVAALGGVLGLYPYAGMRHVSLVIVFVVAAVAFLVRQAVGARPAVILAGALVLMPLWNGTRYLYAPGWPLDGRLSARHYIRQAVDYVRRDMPDGGVIFSDLESHHVFRRYLFQGHPGTWRSSPPGFREYDWNGFRMITLDYWKVSADSLGDELRRMVESFGLEPDTRVNVVSCGWGHSMAQSLRERNIEYADVHEFGKGTAVISVPVGTAVLSDSLDARVRRTAHALNTLAELLSRVLTDRTETVIWPSSYLDSTAESLGYRSGRQVMSYRTFYQLLADEGLLFDALVPGLAFWIFDNRERHPQFTAHMNECRSYAVPGYTFTLLAVDPEGLAGVYLVEADQ
ncbi:glycosyltransferase family 39 protein, partial [candidate division WOR-3 bacterium]|nr:glycosyltransferase family 39 protein [candidate division WOR-3 bacterium]